MLTLPAMPPEGQMALDWLSRQSCYRHLPQRRRAIEKAGRQITAQMRVYEHYQARAQTLEDRMRYAERFRRTTNGRLYYVCGNCLKRHRATDMAGLAVNRLVRWGYLVVLRFQKQLARSESGRQLANAFDYHQSDEIAEPKSYHLNLAEFA